MSEAPDIISEWDKSGNEVIRVALDTFNGKPILSVRCWYRPGGTGELRPGKNGIAIGARHIPALAEAINRALALTSERERA